MSVLKIDIMQYLKYVPFILVGTSILLAVYYIFTKDYVLKWFLKTLEEGGKPSGKALAAAGCINSIIIGYYVALYYSPNHIPPEFLVYTMAGLATSFYGIKAIGNYTSAKFGVQGTIDTSTTTQTTDTSIETTTIQNVPSIKTESKTIVPTSSPVNTGNTHTDPSKDQTLDIG